MLDLQPFQKRFLKRALAPGVDTAALSLPRGQGKSALAAYILARCLTLGDPLNVPGAEYILCAGSIEQARNVFRPLRTELEQRGGYRFIDSIMRIGIHHKFTGTRLRVQSSNGKTAMGIVGCPLLVADEPGAWEVSGGQLMNDAIQTAQGKPGSPLRVIYIGTLAPAKDGWWHDLVDGGSRGSTYVQSLVGAREKWDSWREIVRVNPLSKIDANSKAKLKEERAEARADTRLKARFLSYRLNLPTADESEVLLTVEDWKIAEERAVPPPAGQPIVALDLGGGRSWSAAVAVWENGRVEVMAAAPGIPDLEAQEKRDHVKGGTYQGLYDRGLLDIAAGLRVQPPAKLWESIQAKWGTPVRVVCDRFRLGELQDVIKGASVMEPRVTRWSEAAFDIRALRKMVRDGPLAVAESSRPLLIASLAVATIKNDDQGNTRLVKRNKNNLARDDVAAALTLAAGAYHRAMLAPPQELVLPGAIR